MWREILLVKYSFTMDERGFLTLQQYKQVALRWRSFITQGAGRGMEIERGQALFQTRAASALWRSCTGLHRSLAAASIGSRELLALSISCCTSPSFKTPAALPARGFCPIPNNTACRIKDEGEHEASQCHRCPAWLVPQQPPPDRAWGASSLAWSQFQQL